MVKKGVLSFFVCCLLCCSNSGLNAEVIKLGYVNFPPYEFENNGRPDGILVIIVEKAFQAAGIPLELTILPFKRAYEYTKTGSGQIDGLFNFYKTDARLQYFDYTVPIIENPLVFFIRRDTVFHFNTVTDLTGMKVGVIRGYTYGAVFDENDTFTKSASDSHILNFRKLVLGRIDAYPCDKLVGLYVAMKEKLMHELVIHPIPLKIMNGHIGFTKGKHRGTIDKINQEITRMHRDGEIESIINNYIKTITLSERD